jgi:hypothetical protein
MAVVVIYVLGEDDLELASGEDQHPVEALSTDGADEALREDIRPRTAFVLLRPRG